MKATALLPLLLASLAIAHRTLERRGDAWWWEGKPVAWEGWEH